MAEYWNKLNTTFKVLITILTFVTATGVVYGAYYALDNNINTNAQKIYSNERTLSQHSENIESNKERIRECEKNNAVIQQHLNDITNMLKVMSMDIREIRKLEGKEND